jgi:hypothetical protein
MARLASVPALWLPGMVRLGDRAYEAVADHRTDLGCADEGATCALGPAGGPT